MDSGLTTSVVMIRRSGRITVGGVRTQHGGAPRRKDIGWYLGVWAAQKTPRELKGKIMSFQIGPDRKEIHITSQLVSGPIARGKIF